MTDRQRSWPRAMPALVTPFTEGGDIDLASHEHNTTSMIERGARGLVLAGSTGEGPYLERGERAKLVAVARAADPGLTVICGINAESVRQALAQIEEAAESGADAVLVTTPTTLVRDRTALVEAHYIDVAGLCDLPIFLYSVPRVTGWALPSDSVNRLAGHDRIVGLKDSGGDPTVLAHLTSAINDGFIVYAGASRALAASAHNGAWGAITASANYALTDVSLAARGDASAQQRLMGLTSVIEPHGVVGTKTAAAMVGLRAGASRRPLQGLDDDSVAAIRSVLARHGLVSSQEHQQQ